MEISILGAINVILTKNTLIKERLDIFLYNVIYDLILDSVSPSILLLIIYITDYTPTRITI